VIRRVSIVLTIVVAILLSLGIVMLASTSSVRGQVVFGDPLYFLKRQLLWLCAGVGLCVLLGRFDYHWYRRLAVPLSVATVILLVLVFVPAIGLKVGGSRRWLGLGPFSIQPSEFAKATLVVALAAWSTRVERRASLFLPGLLLPGVGICLLAGLLLLEPDYGTTALIAAVACLMLFAGGANLAYLALFAATGAAVLTFMVIHNPNRLGRVLAFLMPDKYPAVAYHLTQSKIAFIKGGWFGVGLGNSIQKHLYLPEAHTDFILAIIGEELGYIATILVVLLFAAVLVCGITISIKAPDSFGRLLGFGLTSMLVLQAMMNMGVVIGCLPTKGLPLPFISYGGSSLLVSLAMVGILLNIQEHVASDEEDEHTRPAKDQLHRF
jgi:cell division protein FtsW